MNERKERIYNIDLVIEDYRDKYNIELHPDEIEDIIQWGGDEQ